MLGPKLVQICNSMVVVPVFTPSNPLDPQGEGRVEHQVRYQINALDEVGHAWEYVREGPSDPGKWIPLSRVFVEPAQNGSNTIVSHKEMRL